MASTRKKAADAAAGQAPAAQAPAKLDPQTAAAAYARLADERRGLSPDELKPIQGELHATITAARAAIPRLLPLADAVRSELPKHPVQYLESLDDYAQATWYADWLVTHAAGTESKERFEQDLEEARTLRKLLLTSAEPLALKGLIEEAKIKAIRSGAGHDDLASDLLELAALYEEAWPRVKNKTSVEREEVERAAELGQQLQSLLVLRKSDALKTPPEELADQRLRSYTLLLRAYDETSRAVTYLRWRDNDAESFTPSLFKAKRGRPPKGEGTTATPPPVVEAEDINKSDEPPPI